MIEIEKLAIWLVLSTFKAIASPVGGFPTVANQLSGVVIADALDDLELFLAVVLPIVDIVG